MNEFLTGNQAIVRGALRAGCNFFAGYPITPASSICSDMIQALSERGAPGVQTEDEIAAIGQCIGAAMTGAKAMTASSGPGLSLYSENIGLAQMGEVPLVIVDCQRMGPATGGATTTGDGDIVFARHVTAGGFPLPVLAATDAGSAFRLTYEAFNIAERLRTPVIVLASKDISLTRQTVDFNAVKLSPLVARRSAAADAPFVPYAIEEPVDVPAFAPIGGRQRVRFTGSIHDETGVLTIDRAKIARKLTHLREKIIRQAGSLEYVDVDLDLKAETLIVSYGAADGAVREAVAALRAAGTRVSHLTIYSLWPVPHRVLRRAMTPRIRRVIVPELNIGLYGDVLRGFVGEAAIEPILCFDGRLIPPQRIVEHVREPSLDRTTA
ncbi:MAG: pyruvate flavodoxin/ferredoxin oxidoreductase [Planctomycetota bacterium]